MESPAATNSSVPSESQSTSLIQTRDLSVSYGNTPALHGISLDLPERLVVDEAALLARIENRAREAIAAGKEVRKDDNPEAFKQRLEAYRAQTAPVSAFYAQSGRLHKVNGMLSIDGVAGEIDRALDGVAA